MFVKKNQTATGLVQYDAGDWTEEEIEELRNLSLYDINVNKLAHGIFKLNNESGLNFTFGGFTYKGDTENSSYISNSEIIISRNQSVTPQSGYGTPKYDGWQVLESQQKNEKTYITKLIHAGSPENFVYNNTTGYDAYRTEYLLTGTLNYGDVYKFLEDGSTEINVRNWDKYRDKQLEEKGYIKEVRLLTYDEACKLGTNAIAIGSCYWLPYSASHYTMYAVGPNGEIFTSNFISGYYCYGIRPVVELNEGVYIVSGSGVEEDPYILGKD